MPVNSINFNNMACSPLKKDNNVSFARRHNEARPEEKKNNKAGYIAAGAGLVAAVAAAIVFRKQIGGMFSNIKLDGLKDGAGRVKDKVVDFGKDTAEYFKNKAGETITEGQAKILPAMDKMRENVTNMAATVKTNSGEFFKKGWGYVVKGAKAVKDFFVNVFNRVVEFFHKTKAEAPKAAEAAAEAVVK